MRITYRYIIPLINYINMHDRLKTHENKAWSTLCLLSVILFALPNIITCIRITNIK